MKVGHSVFVPSSIWDLIDAMRLRPGLYIGSESIHGLCGYLGGFSDAAAALGSWSDEQDGRSLGGFTRWLAEATGTWPTPKGWAELLLDQCNGDELQAVHSFFERVDAYRGVSISVTTKDLVPPRSFRVTGEELRRVDVVRRTPSDYHFLWLSSTKGTCRVYAAFRSRGELATWLMDNLELELDAVR